MKNHQWRAYALSFVLFSISACGSQSTDSRSSLVVASIERDAVVFSEGSCDAESSGICLDFQGVSANGLAQLCERVNNNPYLADLGIATQASSGSACAVAQRVGTCWFSMEGLSLTMRVYQSNPQLAQVVEGLCAQPPSATPIPGLGGTWLGN
jgi:hypothetical protein